MLSGSTRVQFTLLEMLIEIVGNMEIFPENIKVLDNSPAKTKIFNAFIKIRIRIMVKLER
jgi:hypothetical protein